MPILQGEAGTCRHGPVTRDCTFSWRLRCFTSPKIPPPLKKEKIKKIKSAEAQWQLYVPPSVVLRDSVFYPQNVFRIFLWFSQSTPIISFRSTNWPACIMDTDYVPCETGTDIRYMIWTKCVFKRWTCQLTLCGMIICRAKDWSDRNKSNDWFIGMSFGA